MARTKEFDREQALDRAMQVFWQHGFEATSLDDLLAAMGIARQSLYDTFGDKRALFIAALKRYLERDDPTRTCMATSPSVKRTIRELFDTIIDEDEARQRRGCFAINSALALAPHDPEIAALSVKLQRALEEQFYRALEHARERGELSPAKDIRGLARFLVAALHGLRVAATIEPRSPALRDMARVALQALD